MITKPTAVILVMDIALIYMIKVGIKVYMS